MFDPEAEQAVEKLQKNDKPMAKADQFWQLRKFSARQRVAGKSEQQAFTKYILTDPIGKQLYRQYAETRAVPSSAVAKAADDEPGENEHMQELRKIATAIQAKNPELHLSKAAAMAVAIQTPLGKQAYEMDKRARRVA
jgi:hypothetical protein